MDCETSGSANCLLQCFINTPQIVEYYARRNQTSESLTSVRTLAREAWYQALNSNEFPAVGDKKKINVLNLLEAILYELHSTLLKDNPYRDVSTISDLGTEWQSYIELNNTVIADTFHGMFKKTMTCTYCTREWIQFETFATLSIGAVNVKDSYGNNIVPVLTQTEEIKSGVDVLTSCCSSFYTAKVKYTLVRIPDCLILEVVGLLGRKSKKVEVKLIDSHGSSGGYYQLFAIIGSRQGYTGMRHWAYTKNMSDESWILFENDKVICNVKHSIEKMTMDARICCYRKYSGKPNNKERNTIPGKKYLTCISSLYQRECEERVAICSAVAVENVENSYSGMEIPTDDQNIQQIVIKPGSKSSMDDLIKHALDYTKPDDDIMASIGGVDITRKDFRTLRPDKWLNDNIINGYFKLLEEYCRRSNICSNVCIMNTFFYPKLCREGYSDSIKRWTKKMNIFSFDLLLIPIHLENHWTLVSVDLKTKTLSYYDPLMQGDKYGVLDVYLFGYHFNM